MGNLREDTRSNFYVLGSVDHILKCAECQRNESENSRPLKYNCQWNYSKLKTELGGLIIWLIEAVAIWQPDFHISWELSFSKAKTKGRLRSQICRNFRKTSDPKKLLQILAIINDNLVMNFRKKR